MSDKFGNEVIELTKLYMLNKGKHGVYCETLIKYLNDNAEKLKELKDPYHESNILHLLASNDVYGDMENDLLSEWGGSIKLSGACTYLPCKELNHIIHETIVCMYRNMEKINIFLLAMSGKTTKKNLTDMKSRKENKTPIELLNDYDASKKIIVDGKPYNIKKCLIDIFNRIDPYLSQQVLPSFYSKGVQNKNTVPTNNKELVSRLRKIKVIVTNVLNDLGKPNNIQQPIKGDEPNNSEQQIKGGAEDDGLATLIVRVLKSISEKSPEETGESSFTDASGQVISSSQGSMFSSFSNPFARTSTDSTSQGTGTGTGTDETSDGSVWSESGNDETKNSLFGSLPKLSIPSISSVSFSKKDQLDSLLSDLIDIILNIANNEPLPLSMKDKLLSGLGKFSGIFKGVAPDISGMFKGIAPEEDTGVFVPVDDMGCKIGEDSNPIAKIGNKCIDDNIN